MLATTSSLTTDPNTLRAIEQLAIVVNDVETRLNLVKLALAQSVHTSTPFHHANAITPFSPLASVGLPIGVHPLALLQSLTTPTYAPTLSASVNPYAIMSSLAAAANPYASSISPFSPLATPTVSPFLGVTTPFAHAGLGVSAPSFRL